MSKRLIGAVVGGALMVASTTAVAAESRASLASASPWATLSVMSGAATAATFCGSSAVIAGAQAAIAQGGCVLPQVDSAAAVPQSAASAPPRPIPVPPVEPVGGLYFDPLLLAIGAVAIAALVYFLVVKKGGNSPNSPA